MHESPIFSSERAVVIRNPQLFKEDMKKEGRKWSRVPDGDLTPGQTDPVVG
jgi:hypothetical protein